MNNQKSTILPYMCQKSGYEVCDLLVVKLRASTLLSPLLSNGNGVNFLSNSISRLFTAIPFD